MKLKHVMKVTLHTKSGKFSRWCTNVDIKKTNGNELSEVSFQGLVQNNYQLFYYRLDDVTAITIKRRWYYWKIVW